MTHPEAGAASIEGDVGGAAVELDVERKAKADGAEWSTRVRAGAFRAVVENAVENAVVYHDGEGVEREDGEAWVRVSLGRERGEGEKTDGPERFRLTVADDGPGIPDHEVEAVESGRETALEHGSGLGLWVVAWGAAAVGGDVDYAERDPRGTRVTVSVPIVNGE